MKKKMIKAIKNDNSWFWCLVVNLWVIAFAFIILSELCK